MIDSTNPRSMADNIRYLAGASGSQASDISDLETAVGALQTTVGALQTTVGGLTTYDDEETDTGMKWIDGSSIYRKVFIIESMPNNTTVSIPHNITNLGTMITCMGVMQFAEGIPGRPIPSLANPAIQYSTQNIYIGTSADFSTASAIVILEYTKAASPAPEAQTSPSPEDDTRSIEPEEISEDEYIEPEEVREAPEEEIIEEPVVEVKKTTRKKSTN